VPSLRNWCISAPDEGTPCLPSRYLVHFCTRMEALRACPPASGAFLHQNRGISRQPSRIWCISAPDEGTPCLPSRIWCISAPEWRRSAPTLQHLVHFCTRMGALHACPPASGAFLHQNGGAPRLPSASGAFLHQNGGAPRMPSSIWCISAPEWRHSMHALPHLVHFCTRMGALHACPPASGAFLHQNGGAPRIASAQTGFRLKIVSQAEARFNYPATPPRADRGACAAARATTPPAPAAAATPRLRRP